MSKPSNWSKDDLKLYILLLCANADRNETSEELEMIKSKYRSSNFEDIYAEFKKDSEDEALEKIDENVQKHHFSSLELTEFKQEMHAIFKSDKNFTMWEENLDNILDNIIY
ncbi:hypothetical protein Q2T40_09830 [Winogradskyella maritima]|uniref:Tellurite resistance protein TerB n=1 Tax=Winogradskyella maritima TaxID=1517766 RepID=A0ABV8AD36_9FLAO|nr:hypothetical protein [Winogradskyella maritima]